LTINILSKHLQTSNQTNLAIMRTIGIILLIIGAIGTIVFGIQAMQESESFSILGVDVAVSSANWTPVIISVIVLIVGLVMSAVGRK
jgi:uncharacterized membrane protein YidH (DUF202 family)